MLAEILASLCNDMPHLSGSSTSSGSTSQLTLATQCWTHAAGEVFEGDSAIVAVPLGCLKADAVAFVPPLPDWKRDAIAALGNGNLNKVRRPTETGNAEHPPIWLDIPIGGVLIGKAAIEFRDNAALPISRNCGLVLWCAMHAALQGFYSPRRQQHP